MISKFLGKQSHLNKIRYLCMIYENSQPNDPILRSFINDEFIKEIDSYYTICDLLKNLWYAVDVLINERSIPDGWNITPLSDKQINTVLNKVLLRAVITIIVNRTPRTVDFAERLLDRFIRRCYPRSAGPISPYIGYVPSYSGEFRSHRHNVNIFFKDVIANKIRAAISGGDPFAKISTESFAPCPDLFARMDNIIVSGFTKRFRCYTFEALKNALETLVTRGQEYKQIRILNYFRKTGFRDFCYYDLFENNYIGSDKVMEFIREILRTYQF
ncbi:MAG: hypothetical protein LBB21_00010 [Holosporaceae bacterium]|jgi:hypothetical protein|nr:hypothetical protein [Holosporaceae bacterium]